MSPNFWLPKIISKPIIKLMKFFKINSHWPTNTFELLQNAPLFTLGTFSPVSLRPIPRHRGTKRVRLPQDPPSRLHRLMSFDYDCFDPLMCSFSESVYFLYLLYYCIHIYCPPPPRVCPPWEFLALGQMEYKCLPQFCPRKVQSRCCIARVSFFFVIFRQRYAFGIKRLYMRAMRLLKRLNTSPTVQGCCVFFLKIWSRPEVSSS